MHALNFVYDTLKIRTRVARVWIKTQVCWKFGICQDEFSWGYLPMTSVIISCQNLGVFGYIIRVESLDFARGIYQHAIVVVEVQCCLA